MIATWFANRDNGQSDGWNANNAATSRDRKAASSPDQRYDGASNNKICFLEVSPP